MWFFSSPLVVFGESSLSHLNQIQGKQVFLVTDRNIVSAGLLDLVKEEIPHSLKIVGEFCDVEPDPSLTTAERGAQELLQTQPDWIIAIGGGSVIDAAKAMWILYERPDIPVISINPVEILGLRNKARFIAIPTTTGTGSEATWVTVLTDPIENRKLGLGNRECLPDIAILDPEMVRSLPHAILVDTALDALTHAIEGFSSTWHNPFSDGLCLQAAAMICTYLPKVIHDPSDYSSKAELQNAATLAGLGRHPAGGRVVIAATPKIGDATGPGAWTPWASEVGAVRESLATTAEGLSDAEVISRRAEVGPNRLPAKTAKSGWRLLFRQFRGFLNLTLMVAAVIAGLVGDVKDAALISSVVVFNALLGFLQEHRAEKALAAAARSWSPTWRVSGVQAAFARSRPTSSCQGTSFSSRPGSAFQPMGDSSSPTRSRSTSPPSRGSRSRQSRTPPTCSTSARPSAIARIARS